MEKIKKWQTWILIIICLILNFIGREIAHRLQLPIWFDAVGTIIAAIELGAFGGGFCGALSNAFFFALERDVLSLPYMLVSVVIGVVVGHFFPRKKANSFIFISMAVMTGLVATVISTPINLLLYDGRTGNLWGDAVIDMLSHNIRVPVITSFVAEFFVDFPDKTLSFFIASGIILLSRKLKKATTKSAVAGIILIPVVLSLIPAASLEAKNQNVDFASEFTGELYDTDDGLASVEINALAQTDDGYIWVGTYSGLYRYDGYRFYEKRLDERIKNVMALHVDKHGNLWIGTNDSGIACYDPKQDTIEFYTIDDGFGSNSIRAVTEDLAGNIYVSTIADMCVIDPDRKVNKIDRSSVHGVIKLAANGDVVAGVKNDGAIVVLQDKKVKFYFPGNFASIDACSGGDFIVGTTSNITGLLAIDDGKAEIRHKFYCDALGYFNDLCYSENYGGYFACCENGLGFINDKGVVTDMTSGDFNTSIDDCLIDYQGNVWFASSKQGIMRFTWNPFEDLFSRAKIGDEVVNCSILKDGLLYAATGAGLVTIDLKTYYSVPIPKPQYLKNVRIRHILNDRDGNLWFSTYGENGLIEMKADKSIVIFKSETKGTEGDRFRLCHEMSDGRIVAASNSGVSFIKNDKVESTLGEDTGMPAQVLCIVEDEDSGRLLMGSDGAGIYVVENNRVVDYIDEDDGLKTLVVMKIIPCTGGYIFVTSNALYYYSDGNIKRLENFPYSNNYDVFIDDEGSAWVLSSAGIFIVDVDELIADGDYNYTLLNKNSGLRGSITANATYAFNNGLLYLCCTDGVRRIDVKDYSSYSNVYNIRISDLVADDVHVKPVDDVYHIPATPGRIQFDVAILNFTMSNPYIHIFLEGSGDEGVYCYQNSMQNLIFTNLRYGDYKLHVQVYDSSGTTLQREQVFNIKKDSMLYERQYFLLYFFFVCAAFVLYIGWVIGNLVQNANNLERWQNAATTDSLTGLINKRGADFELTRACASDKGILMILDLDSFKPVNDIYGHDMGDKILISMAQLMKTCTRQEDILCRLGGDEFVAFLRNADRDMVVDDKTKFLNNEILKAARTYLGKDMEIPIGVSVGAVKVPDEGNDYHELLAKADKALYEAKDKGKHAFAIFSSAEGAKPSVVDQTATGGITSIKKIMAERGPSNCAYTVDYNSLEDIYRVIKRVAQGRGVNCRMIHFEIVSDEDKVSEVMERFLEIVKHSLRRTDIVCVDGENRVLAIVFPENEDESQEDIVKNIISKWEKEEDTTKYMIRYDIGNL